MPHRIGIDAWKQPRRRRAASAAALAERGRVEPKIERHARTIMSWSMWPSPSGSFTDVRRPDLGSVIGARRHRRQPDRIGRRRRGEHQVADHVDDVGHRRSRDPPRSRAAPACRRAQRGSGWALRRPAPGSATPYLGRDHVDQIRIAALEIVARAPANANTLMLATRCWAPDARIAFLPGDTTGRRINGPACTHERWWNLLAPGPSPRRRASRWRDRVALRLVGEADRSTSTRRAAMRAWAPARVSTTIARACTAGGGYVGRSRSPGRNAIRASGAQDPHRQRACPRSRRRSHHVGGRSVRRRINPISV